MINFIIRIYDFFLLFVVLDKNGLFQRKKNNKILVIILVSEDFFLLDLKQNVVGHASFLYGNFL